MVKMRPVQSRRSNGHLALRFEGVIEPEADVQPVISCPDIIQIAVPVAELMAIAMPRLRRQKPYAGPLARGGHRAAALEGWLDAAAGCLSALARPSITHIPVETRLEAGGVMLGGRLLLDDTALASDMAGGGELSAYLLTLGVMQPDALAWLKGDYGARHVQADLSREVLFALGRKSQKLHRARASGARQRRISLQTAAQCGDRALWDPAQVQALLGLFDGVNPGVTVSDTGCFQPLDVLLGLTVRI